MSAELPLTDAQPGTWWALDRDVDPSGVSGTGRVGYALVLHQGVLLLWDTTFILAGEPQHSQGVERLRSVAMLITIHCHDGKTRLTRIDAPGAENWPAVLHAEKLLRQAETYLDDVLIEIEQVLT